METAANNQTAAQSGALPAGAPGQAPVQSDSQRSTEEQRAKWRAKGAAQRARKRGQAGSSGAPAPGAALSPTPPGASGASTAVTVAPPVLWNPQLLRPLFEELIPSLEAVDIASLKSDAAKVGPDAVALVVEKAKWNPASKTTLTLCGPSVTAKWLNRLGVGAENSEEVFVGIALVAIFTGRMLLASELRQMAAEKADAERKRADARKESPNAGSAHN